MKKIIFTFFVLISISFSINAQNIDESLLKDKYWVESTNSPSDKLILFESKKNYVKNVDSPFSPSVFHFNNDNSLIATDTRWCAGMLTSGELNGGWSLSSNVLEFKLSDCVNSFVIKELSNDKMLIEIQ